MSESMKRLFILILVLTPLVLIAQAQSTSSSGGLDPATILKPLGESWPTYSGDYSGRRYSSLNQISQATLKNLGLAWVSRGFVQGSGPSGRGPGNAGAGGGGGGRGAGPEVPLTIAGEGSGDY